MQLRTPCASSGLWWYTMHDIRHSLPRCFHPVDTASSSFVCRCKAADTCWSNQSYCSVPASLWQPPASLNLGPPVTTGNGLYPTATNLQHLVLWVEWTWWKIKQKGRREKEEEQKYVSEHLETKFLSKLSSAWGKVSTEYEYASLFAWHIERNATATNMQW